MRAVYGAALGLGLLAVIGWLAAVAAGGSKRLEGRFGAPGRRVIGAVFGFGMAGLSASYAGWPTAGAAGAALAGAILAGWWAGRAGRAED